MYNQLQIGRLPHECNLWECLGSKEIDFNALTCAIGTVNHNDMSILQRVVRDETIALTFTTEVVIRVEPEICPRLMLPSWLRAITVVGNGGGNLRTSTRRA